MAMYAVITTSNLSSGEIREHFDTEPEAVTHMNFLRVFDQKLQNEGATPPNEIRKYRIEKVGK